MALPFFRRKRAAADAPLCRRRSFDELRLFHVLKDDVGWDGATAYALTKALAQQPPDTLAIRDILVLHGGFSERAAQAFIGIFEARSEGAATRGDLDRTCRKLKSDMWRVGVAIAGFNLATQGLAVGLVLGLN